MDADYPLFARIVETGSLAAAGRALGLSPAMVSKRLARLEARLGARLIHRTTRRLSLTSRGERFHEDVVAILAAVRAAEARVAGGEGAVGGLLRIAAPTSFGRMHVAPHLAALIDAHPQLSVSLDLDDRFVDLLGERIDIAVRIAGGVEPGMVAHRLATNRRILCAAPAYCARYGSPARLADLARHRLLGATFQFPWRLEGPEGLTTLAGESVVATNSSEVARELAVAGAGIALRSLWDVWRELADGRLVRVLPDHEGARDIAVLAVHPDAPLVPAGVTAFIAHMRALYAGGAPWE